MRCSGAGKALSADYGGPYGWQGTHRLVGYEYAWAFARVRRLGDGLTPLTLGPAWRAYNEWTVRVRDADLPSFTITPIGAEQVSRWQRSGRPATGLPASVSGAATLWTGREIGKLLFLIVSVPYLRHQEEVGVIRSGLKSCRESPKIASWPKLPSCL